MPKVELAIHSGHQDIQLDEVRQMWREFDEGGIDMISVWDHMYESPYKDGSSPTFEALTLLTALAVETKNCKVSCLCFGMAYRSPSLLAKALTTIDHLSNGRLIVGIGAGWHVPEHEAFGFDFPEVKERLDRLSEGTRILRAMLNGPNERTTFNGKYYRVNNIANYPRPVQAHVPIIVGGGGEKRTMAIAARYGDGTNQGYMNADRYAEKNKVADEWCEKLGRDPKSLERSTLLHWRIFTRPRPESPVVPGSLYGEPQQVIDQIGEYIDAGSQRISLAIRPPLDWDAIHSFIEDVVPIFK
ncbi:MAG TPA: LLM class flavin-dependent oxidoreductase [Dehalococcoidia bacterium]|nr:LLM class flavin-dependent oxidoreductase [Dehalococcoidia bacterium]